MEERLNLLCDAGIIDRDIRDGILDVADKLETVWGIPVHNEQGEMALTHLANALMRSRRKEEIAPLDSELFDEISSSTEWEPLKPVHLAILAAFDVRLHPNEEGYLMANLFSLWMRRHD